MEKKCLECGDPIKGRIDKKFCSDQCRNNYNNRQKSDETNHIRNVNHILKKNRRILMELNPTGKTNVSEKQLLEKGFNLNYITNFYTTKAGRTYKFCYEYGYIEQEGGWYTLVMKQDYLK